MPGSGPAHTHSTGRRRTKPNRPKPRGLTQKRRGTKPNHRDQSGFNKKKSEAHQTKPSGTTWVKQKNGWHTKPNQREPRESNKKNEAHQTKPSVTS